jgi:tetratricopeptide (TPR) repeat protein
VLDREGPNLRAALRWLIEQRSMAAVQMAGALNRFWLIRGYLREGLTWLEQALAVAGEAATREAQLMQADALKGSGILSAELGLMAQARSSFERALMLWRQADESAMIARTLNNLGIMTMNEGHFAEAIPFFEESIALAQGLADHWSVANTQNNLGLAFVALGQYEQAVKALYACAAYSREVGDEANLIANLINLGLPLLELGREAEATACCREALERAYRLNSLDGIAYACEGLAQIALGKGFVVQAVRLLGAAEALQARIGIQRQPMFEPTFAKLVERSKAQLTPAAWQEAYEEGEGWTLEELMTEAARAPVTPGPQ